MKIALSEIWNFSDLIHSDEPGWSYKLVAGEVVVTGIGHSVIMDLKNDESYDTELLPSVFTFREILWQPDVFTEVVKSMPSIRILKAHCVEMVEEYENSGTDTKRIYSELLQGLIAACDVAVAALDEEQASVKKVLGDFRTNAFPLIKFFISHPKNRADYYKDAINRLNYAVKIMLTQFHGKYTELTEPYWEVSYDNSSKSNGATDPAAVEKS